jgi:transcriptional regulator with XRE-family HTH domain
MHDAARQLLRAIRGRRSQVAFSRRLGYRGNVAAKWEGGHRFPTFAEAIRAAERVGIDVSAAFVSFHAASAPSWSANELAPWLNALRGRANQAGLAERSGLSRQQVGRLLSGRAEGRLPEVMALIDAMTGRLPDLVGALVPIEQVPSLAREAAVRSALARLAVSHPWSPAAQAWLDTRGCVSAQTGPAELARSIGVQPEQAAALLDALVAAGVAVQARGMIEPAPPATVEVHATPADLQQIRAHWAAVTAARVARGEPDLFSFNVFAIGRADLERVRDAQRRFYREVRAIVADSPPEVAAMLVVHTAAFDDRS